MLYHLSLDIAISAAPHAAMHLTQCPSTPVATTTGLYPAPSMKVYLSPLEKVDVRKLAHLVHVVRLHHFLVVEEHPLLALALQLLANERHIVTAHS